jgi:uncharacterized protein YutE (UPF0331/DUF86 family)
VPDKDLVLAKVATVERCLARVVQVTGGDLGRLDDLDVEDIVVLNLQRAAQACIDLAHHLVASLALGLPTSLREAFALLARGGGLDGELAVRLEAMVGFRNIAVHDYQAIDRAVLRAIVEGHLDDLRAFCRYAVGRLTPVAP